MKARTALLVIDVQRGLIEGFEDDWAGVLQTIGELVERARQAQIPVVFVQHGGEAGHPLAVGSSGWQIHPMPGLALVGPRIAARSAAEAF